MSDPHDGLDEQKRRRTSDLADQVGRNAARKAKARRVRRHGLWFGLGMMGLVGWAIAVPTLAGVLLGRWLDAVLPQAFSWTVALLFAGVVIGGANAWWWVKRESESN